jgi:hypothetical protein
MQKQHDPRQSNAVILIRQVVTVLWSQLLKGTIAPEGHFPSFAVK